MLGRATARKRRDSRSIRVELVATAAFVTLGALFVASEVRFNSLPDVAEDFALGGQVPVLCLGADPREYGLIARPEDYAGDDVLIVAPRSTLAQVTAKFGASFDSVEALPAASVRRAGRPAMVLPLFMGHRFH